MHILSINNTNYRFQDKKISQPNFGAVVKQPPKIGVLKSKTSYMIQDFLHGYRDIKNMLGQKTAAGLEKIALYYPEVTIGENLVFHNCGEDKNSISIRVAESEKYRGLTYIARREGDTENTRKNILNSFMISNHDKLIKNFKPNYSKCFPEEKIFITQEEIENEHLEENLQKLLEDLDPMLLKFRKFLAKNNDIDLKLPDGKISYPEVCNIKEAFRIFNEIEEQAARISNKRILAMNSSFEDYKPVTGLKSYMFQNLGSENLSIHFTEWEDKNGFNLKRLYVYDKDNNPIKVFGIIDNEKFITNINPKYPSTLPEKYIFANSEELEKEYLPEFKKYFELYNDKLRQYQKHVNKTVDSLFKQEIQGEFSIESASLLSEALDWYKLAKIKLRKLPSPVATSIKTKVEKLEPATGRTGLWLKDEEENRIIQFLPINSRAHDNLIRISIIEENSSNKKDFLVHNFKHIVKNYNPQYPTIIPKILKYASEREIEENNLEATFRFLKNKCEEFATKADDAYEKREKLAKDLDRKEQTAKAAKTAKKVKKVKIAKKEQEKSNKIVDNTEISLKKTTVKLEKLKKAKEYKEYKKACKEIFIDAFDKLNDIMQDFEYGTLYNEGLENFNEAMAKIINNIKNFHSAQRKAKLN